MTQVVLLVGTRKGCFVLSSDADRRDWEVRGPFCEGWPIFNAVHDPTSGALYAAAASEWHGAGVWRSNDLGETWSSVERGLRSFRSRAEALQDHRPDGDARAHPRRHRGGRHLREHRRRRQLVAPQHARRPTGPGRLERSRQAAAGASRACRDPPASGRRLPLLGRDPGVRDLRDHRRRRVVDPAQQGPSRGVAARESRGRLLRPQARDVTGRPGAHVPAEPLRHAPERRRRAHAGRRSPTGCRATSASLPPPIRTTARAST